MKWRCPRPERARQIGCLNVTDAGLCIRKEWSGLTYFKAKGSKASARAEAYCERVKAILRED